MPETRKPVRKTAQKKVAAKPKRTAPVDTVMLRTSERRSFRRCRQQWWWAWREGLKPGFTTGALWFGEGVHFALAEWYKQGSRRGPHPAVTFADWVGDERRRIYTQPKVEVDETEIVDAKELGVAMLESYVDHYQKDSDLKFIATEQPFQIVVPMVKDETGIWVATGQTLRDTLYCGTFDGVFRDDDGRLWLIEHKTAKAISTAHLPLDDQAGSYWLVATQVLRNLGVIGPKEELEGIRYNFLRKAMPDERPTNAEGMRLNKDGSVSQKQPAPYFYREDVFRFAGEQRTQMRRIQDESLEMQLVRQGVLPVTKNPTKDCSWDCAFFQMCQLHEAGDDWEMYRDATYHVEDPYAAHRKSAAE